MTLALELFSEALWLEEPWHIDRSRLDAETGVLALHLAFDAGGLFSCGSCGEQGCKAYDTAMREWRHLDFLQHRTVLRAPHPRVKCPRCGVRQAAIPWARPRSAYTVAFEFRVAELLASKMAVKDAAAFLDESNDRLRRVARHYAERHGTDGAG